MQILLAPLVAALQLTVSVGIEGSVARDTVPLSVRAEAGLDSATLASAYEDPWAREMIRLARERQNVNEKAILAYRALVRQRFSVGMSTLRRERLLYRRESAARIHWRRYGRLEVDLLGAREVVPIALPDAQVPSGLERSSSYFLFDPADHRFILGDSTESRNDGLRHPLAPGSEAHYRYARGDSTLISLPDGRTVRLAEVRVTPRRSDPHLLSGSLWFDAESHALAQAVFQLARPFDAERDADDDDREDLRWIPGFLKPIQADLRYLTIDYGLWEMRWWLPRVIAFEGYGSAGSLLRVPIRYELSYSEYEIFEDPVELPKGIPFSLESLTLAGDTLPHRQSCRGVRGGCRCYQGVCRPVEVRIPEDSTLLLTHPALPPSIYSEGPELIDEEDIRAALALLREARRPIDHIGPRLYWGLDKPGLTRYNRVEGLSTGVMLGGSYGPLSTELTARMAWADRRNPGFTLAARWEGKSYHTRIGAYREVVAVDPAVLPFSLTNSLGALLWGRDDGDYYRALGVELAGGPAPGGMARLDWRVYAERQRPVEQRTRTSLRRLWSDENPFRPNLRADTADLVGAALTLRLARGLDPVGFRWGGDLSLDGAVGSHRVLRPSARIGVSGPLPGGLIGSLEGAAGAAFGEVPAQMYWPLGGTPTLRGYDPFATSGESFWRARAELGNRFPGGRIIVFSDLGWAGTRELFPGARPLVSAGVGGSLLDGLLRIDLARALRAPTGWRLSLSADMAL